ncbi:MAG: rRNA maturation RNase YbeY [Pseudomonadota bacterium]
MTEPAAIEVLLGDDRWTDVGLASLAAQAIDAVCRVCAVPAGYAVSVLGCDDREIARLNADFRDKPSATNVLSWPDQDLAPLSPGDVPGPIPDPTGFDDTLGDIAISYDTCLVEAQAAGLALKDHVTHLMVHGCLHLLGYDHEHERDAVRMEALEVKILADLGVSNPYLPRRLGSADVGSKD